MKLKSLILSLIVLLTGAGLFLFSSRPAGVPERHAGKTDSLRLCAANINYSNTRTDEVSQALLSTGADVFVITEWRGDNLIPEAFARRGYRFVVDMPRKGTHGIGVIVRKGLHAWGQTVASPVDGPCSMPLATLRLRQSVSEVTILGIHTPPPVPGCKSKTDPTIRGISQWVAQGRLKKAVGTGREGDPVLMAGDFNAFSFNPELRGLLSSGMVDTYSEAGAGYGPTWRPFDWLPPLFRIDYIFAPEGTEVAGAYRIALPGSDHSAVVSDVVLRGRLNAQGDS